MENLFSFFNLLDDFIFVLDEFKNIVFINIYSQNNLGYSLHEVLGKSVEEIYPEQLDKKIEEIFISGSDEEYCIATILLINKEGKYIPVETKLKKVFMYGKTYMIAIHKDMRAQCQINDKFTKVFEKISYPMSIITYDTLTYVEVNNAFLELFEYKENEVVGKNLDEFDKIIDGKIRIPRYFEKNDHIRNESFDIITKTGEIKNVKISIEILNVQDEKFYLTTFFEVTELLKKEEALKESEEKFRMLFENMTDSFSLHEIIYDDKNEAIDFRYLSANKAYENYFGQKAEGIVGKTIKEINPNADIKMIKKYASVAESGTPFRMEYYSETFKKHIEVYVFSPKKGQFAAISSDISDRKNMENKIKEISEEKERVFEYAVSMSCIAGFDGYFKRLNSSWEKTLGWTIEELMARPFIEFVHEEDREKTLRTADGLSEGNNVFNFENRYLCKNGTYKWVLWNSTFDIDKQLIYASVIDITDRKLAEETIKENEKKLQTIFDIFDVGITVTDKEGNIIDCNKASEEILGISKEEHLARNYKGAEWQIIKEDMSILKPEEYTSVKALKENRAFSNEIMGILKKDSTISWISVNAIPMELKNYGVLVSYVDITKIKEAEEKIKQVSQRLTLATSAAGIGVWEYNVVNNQLIWDDQMFALYGMDKNNFLGAYETWQNGLHPEDKNVSDIQIQMALRGEKDFNTEFRVVWPNGEVRNIKALSMVQRDKNGNAIKMIGTNWDITQQKIQEQQLLLAKEKAELANTAKSEFLANMSHEIRTPMNAIIGFSELLSKEMMEEKSKKYLLGIKTAGNNLLQLINDILDLSKLESGKLEIQYEKTDIKDILDEIGHIFHWKVQNKGIDFQIDFRGYIPSLMIIDELRVRQILLNLVGNSIKFTEFGYIKIILEILNVDNSNNKLDLVIKVEDTGVGISKEQQSIIFDAFVQQDGQSTRKYGGTGLGLTICRRLANMMDGEIGVESDAGKGSIFSLLLKNVTYSDEVKISKEIEENPVEEFGFAKILIVEDISSNIEILEGYLAKYNFEISIARNGLEGVEKAKAEKPDLILMDIQMPIMNGYEAVKLIKSDEKLGNIKIVMLTATTIMEENRLSEEHIDGFLRKPVKIEDLIKELSKHLKVIKTKEVLSGNRKQISLNNDLKKLLKEKMTDKWKEINELIMVEDVETFAEELKEIAMGVKSDDLYKYAQTLYELAADFDIENMKIEFKKFKKIVNSEN